MSIFYKKILLFLIFLTFKNNSFGNESILDYESRIRIQENALVNITEIIKVMITKDYISHDIYRELPLVYNQIPTYLKIESLIINNKKIKFYTKQVDNRLRIYFGSKKKKIPPGIHVFIIKYSLRNIISYSNGFDVFDWDINGVNWGMDILNSSVTLILPKNKKPNSIYAYVNNNTLFFDSVTKDIDDNPVIEIEEVVMPYENISIKVIFSKNSIKHMKFSSLIYNLDVIISILGCLFSIIYILIRYLKFGVRVSQSSFVLGLIIPYSFITLCLFVLPKYYYILNFTHLIVLLLFIAFSIIFLKKEKKIYVDYFIALIAFSVFIIYISSKISDFVVFSLSIIIIFNFITSIISFFMNHKLNKEGK